MVEEAPSRERSRSPRQLRERASPEQVRRGKQDRRVEDRIRAWRRDEATKRGVPNLVVLPNPGMAWLVSERPRSVDALAACPDIGPKRMARYGEKLIALLKP